MATQGVGTYKLNSFWESGRLIYYEKAYGHTTTGDVFILGHDYVQVGDTANDVDMKWLGTTTGTFTLDAAAHTLAMTGVATSTDGSVTVSLTTDASSLTAGALIVAGGIACAKKLFIGDDIDMSVSGTGVYDIVLKTNVADALSIKDSAADIIVFETTTGAPVVTITPITTHTGVVTINGGITMGDAKNIVVNATTGTKIGTATSQKLGFYNATPVVQQTGCAVPTEINSAITAITALRVALNALGFTTVV